MRSIDSLAVLSTSGDTTYRRNEGTSRLRLIDSHSAITPPATSSYRQYELRRQRNPRSSPGGSSRSSGVSGSDTSAIRVAVLTLAARVAPKRVNVTTCSVLYVTVTSLAALQPDVDAHAVRSALEDARPQDVFLFGRVRLQFDQQLADRHAGNEDGAAPVMDECAWHGHPPALRVAGLHLPHQDDAVVEHLAPSGGGLLGLEEVHREKPAGRFQLPPYAVFSRRHVG